MVPSVQESRLALPITVFIQGSDMKLELIDFSDVYYGAVARKAKPPRRVGKFMQLRNNTTEYLVLSPTGLSTFHADIVERFCRTKGICGRYAREKPERFEIDDHRWDVVGGGHWEMDDEKKMFLLSGSSYVYGRFAPSRLHGKLETVASLKGYRIVIK